MSTREERRARAEARADRAWERVERAEARYDAEPAHMIPLGQPILVGHHSQRRHERDLARLDRSMRDQVEAREAAMEAERRARQSGYAINVADADAVEALRGKLAAAEAEHRGYVSHNRAVRAGQSCPDGRCSGCAKLAYYGDARGVLPRFVLANSKGRQRQIREQLRKAEAHAAAAAEAPPDAAPLASGQGWALSHDVADARVRFVFDGKPNAETRDMLKRYGFRWAPSVGAWQRQDTSNGLAVARMVADRLGSQHREGRDSD